MVMLEFAYGTDLDKASQSINDNLNLVADFFPDDASQPTIFKLNTNMMPVMNIALRSSSDKDANELRALMEDVIQNQIDRVGGVSNTSINGGQDAIVQVAIDQNRLEAYGVTLSQVSFALNPQNVQVGAGTMVEGNLSYLLRTDAEFSSLEEIENVMIMSLPNYDNTGNVTGSSVIRLKDLCNIRIDSVGTPIRSSVHTGEIDMHQVKKIQWVPESGVTTRVLVPSSLYDEHKELVPDSMGEVSGISEPAVAQLPVDEVVQFERYGFVRIDAQNGTTTVIYAHR